MFFSTVIPLVVMFASAAWAQTTIAECGSGFEWNKNSLGQDPCVIASILDAKCHRDGFYAYFPIANRSQTYPPVLATSHEQLKCDCNTVMYSLVMACASCQGGSAYSWAAWSQVCKNVTIAQYPTRIFGGTAVPRWAFYNVTSLPDATYNGTVARSVGQYPEETLAGINNLDAGNNGTTESSITESPSSDPSSTNRHDTVNGGTNYKAIIGVFIGILALVVSILLAILAFICKRQRRRQRARQLQPQQTQNPLVDEDPFKQPPVTVTKYRPPVTFVHLAQCDPSDPLTFPPRYPSLPNQERDLAPSSGNGSC